MSHYFTTPADQAGRHEVRAAIWGRTYTLLSSSGVFSANRLDPGTAVLLKLTDPPADRPARFLDLGCGYGPITIGLAASCPQARIDAIDSNRRALELTRENADRLGVGAQVATFAPEQAPEAAYDEIWSNPPIRIGKPALHQLLTVWLGRLAPHGQATMVVAKNLGADSLTDWLATQGWAVARLGSSQGFRVLRVSMDTASTSAGPVLT